MPIDPKITTRLPTMPTTTTTPRPVAQPQPQPAPQTVQPRTTGFEATSTFQPGRPVLTTRNGGVDDSIGRGRGGVDDSIGRTSGKGGYDDGIGRTSGKGGYDDGIGRTSGKGGYDDGIGRTNGKGGYDDGIGGDLESVRHALVGRTDTPDANALREAINNRLETPSFLKGSDTIASQVFNFARSKLGLSATQTGQLTTVLKGATNETAKLVGALCEKCPEALTNVDSKGQTLLANLAKLASQPMNPLLSGDTTRGELMSAVLRDVVNPNRIDQGDAPTCTVTSMQFELVADEPAEYVRLMSDLSGPQGRAKMRGQSDLMLQAGDASHRDGRSISQTIFQTVAMEFGNGRTLEFDPRAGGSFDAAGNMVQRGLKPEQQTQVLRQLFGVNYRSELFQTEAEGAKVLEKLRKYDTRTQQNRPILLQIDQGTFNHAVTFERVADNKVYFRDPYGELRSMPENQFKTFVVGLHAPKDANIVT